MPDWVWTLIILLFVYEKWMKVRVFDIGRGLIHIEFAETKLASKVKTRAPRKQLPK